MAFHGPFFFTALNGGDEAALMGPRCNSETDPGDGRSTNILFFIVPAHSAPRAFPTGGGGRHRAPRQDDTFLQTEREIPKSRSAGSNE